MSGHNKWSKIKHKKAATDGQKSKIFGKVVRLITVEAKKSGGDVNAPGMRLALEKAREVNMPKDNIDRAIHKATETGGAQMDEVLYEAYGPGGTALIIEGLTDNRNKTAAEVRFILSKNNLEMAATGSAMWAFERTPNREFIAKTTVPISEEDGEKLSNLIEMLEESDEIQNIYTNAE